uniref:Uncharacterized protein n=1 Tax=Rhizophora mucronata TaxID=61149 RepID=A0A2P2QZ84_RHIMU
MHPAKLLLGDGVWASSSVPMLPIK